MSCVEEWLLEFIPEKGNLALDVGANVGAWTTFLSKRFNKVHSFEPNPQVLPTLRACVKDLLNVSLFEVAISNTTKWAPFNLYSSSEHGSLDPGRIGIQETIEVPCQSLNQYLGSPFDFLKIDTEGAESAVLTGALLILTIYRPSLIIEIHSLDQLGLCQELLKRAGYDQVQHISHPNTSVHSGHCWLSTNDESVRH